MATPNLRSTRPEVTGERIDPLQSPALYLQQHVARYIFAARYCEGKVVLDAGCGMGYGSEFLSRQAREVVGIDLDPAAIEHCQRTYSRGPQFRCHDAQRLPQDWGEKFDVVVAFEAIEHFADASAFLQGARQVLKAGGRLVVSTPNKAANPLTSNQFHVREYWPQEFERVLAECGFGKVEMYGQCPNPAWRVGLNLALGAGKKVVACFHRGSLGIGGKIEASSHSAVERPFTGELVEASRVRPDFMPKKVTGRPSFLIAVASRD